MTLNKIVMKTFMQALSNLEVDCGRTYHDSHVFENEDLLHAYGFMPMPIPNVV